MTFAIHASKKRPEHRDYSHQVRLLLSRKLAYWNARAGKFTLPTQPSTSSPPRTSIDFHRFPARRRSLLRHRPQSPPSGGLFVWRALSTATRSSRVRRSHVS
jgi:hypothetical protein